MVAFAQVTRQTGAQEGFIPAQCHFTQQRNWDKREGLKDQRQLETTNGDI